MHSPKAYRKMDVQAPRVLNISLDAFEWSASRPYRSTPIQCAVGTLYSRKLGRPRSLSGHHEEEKYFCLTVIEFRFADDRMKYKTVV